MSPGRNATVAVGGGALVVALEATLLRRMRHDLDTAGALSVPTVRRMWAGYAALGVLDALALLRTPTGPPSRPLVRTTAGALAGAGAAASAASMAAFQTTEQLNAKEAGELVTGGLYRVSRNPQYAGFVVLLGGLAALRRSFAAAVVAGATGVVLARWIPAEEALLERQFGAEYRTYRGRVRRWVGPPAPRRARRRVRR